MELLGVGLIKYLIMMSVNKLTEKYIKEVAYKKEPELIYYSTTSKNNIKKVLFNILLYGLYCIPGVSNLILALNIISDCSCAVYAKKCPDAFVNILKNNMINPDVRTSRMDFNRTFYNSKTIADSLQLEGASETDIERMINRCKREVDYIDYEDDTIYSGFDCKRDNLRRLRRYSDLVENPVKLYKDTKNLRITDVSISDSELESLIVHMERLEGDELNDYLDSCVKTYKLK